MNNQSRPIVSIISPTYNEAENIGPLMKLLSGTLFNYNFELILVDDNSKDGTAEIAKGLSVEYPVNILIRKKKLGLASAILTGFKFARGNILGVIDADLQHPPKYLPSFLNAMDNNCCDFVIGSRYMVGGGIEGWSTRRLLISKLASLFSKPLINQITDPMSGFFFLKRNVIEGVTLNPTGYKLCLEILVKGKYNGVKEIPYVFKSRKNGASKLNKKEILDYLTLLKHLYAHKLKKQSWQQTFTNHLLQDRY